jgi:homogentisate 1,2-dioxygenase
MGAGPPRCMDGLNVGVAFWARPPPHDGEMHPDGDELIYLTSGAISVVLEDPTERTVHVRPGDCFIVPQGILRRLLVHRPSQLIPMTPGPRKEYRLPNTRRP